jgi:hypothetical protein
MAVAVAVSLAGAMGVPSGRVSAASASFTLVDAGVNGSELNIGVGPDGAVYVGGWDAVARSLDGGASWDRVQPGKLASAVGFGADRVLVVDHQTGVVFEEDTTLGCTVLSYSKTHGSNWKTNPAACGAGATDHAKVAVGPRVAPYKKNPSGALYPNLVYVCANGLTHDDCGVSADGGLTFQPTTPHGIGCAFQGTPVVSSAGVLYEPTSACGLQVRSTANAGTTWTETGVGFPTSSETPDIAVTPDGTLYLAYIDSGWRPALARSTDGGASWTGPYSLAAPGITSSLFPVVVAGADGRIAVAYYGTTDGGAGWDLNPGNAPDNVRWNGYITVIDDAAGASPTVAPQQVTTDPLQYGCLSKLGGCLNNIADYADIDAGPDGRVYAVFVDGCLPGCTGKAGSTSDRAIVAVQTGGTFLR